MAHKPNLSPMFLTSHGGFGLLSFSVSCSVGVLLRRVIIPVVQGRSAGIDAYTAICRRSVSCQDRPRANRSPIARHRHRSRKWCGRPTCCDSGQCKAGTGPRQSARGLRRLSR